MKKTIIIFFIFFIQPSFADEFFGSFKQGSFILGKTKPGSKVSIDRKEIRVTNDGYFAFGLDRDRNNNVLIKIIKDNDTKIIEKKSFKKRL